MTEPTIDRFDYEDAYKRLRESGAPGWAGSDQARSEARLAVAIDTLLRGGHLPAPPARALELGCGNGAACLHLAERGYGVSGIDISPTATNWARERFERAGIEGWFATGDVCDMRSLFADRQFDIAYDGACLHCLIGDDRRSCLDEVRRILRPGGRLVVSSMCGSPRMLGDALTYDPSCALLLRGGQPYRTIPSLPALRWELIAAGFSVEYEHVADNPWWDHATLVCRRHERPGPNGASVALHAR